MKTTSLTRQLVLGVLICITIIWTLSSIFIWFNAQHELAEIIEAVPIQLESFKAIEQEREELTRSLLINLFAPLLLSLPIIGAAIVWIIWRTTRGLRTLQASVLNRSPSDTSALDTHSIPIEIKPVVVAFNNLMQLQNAQIEQERRFNANAAHELRTPLAVMRSYAEVAQLSKSQTERAFAVQEMIYALDRYERLITQLLTLSKIERLGQVMGHDTSNASSLQPVNLLNLLRETITEVANHFQDEHDSVSIDWQLHLVRKGQAVDSLDATAHTQADLLKVLLRNLLNNAANYASQDKTAPHNRSERHLPIPTIVRCTLQVKACSDNKDEISIMIEDNGAGMAQQDIAKLGERFFRADAASGTGSGLGWSIIKNIASFLGLSIHASKSADLGGLSVTVCLVEPIKT